MSATATPRPALRRLAARLGILPRYVDTRGVTRRTSDRTAEALAAALGHDASTEAEAAHAARRLAAHDEAPLAPTRVCEPAAARRLPVALPPAHRGRRGEWHVELVDEQGDRTAASGRVHGRRAEASLGLPVTPPHGYHRLRLTLVAPGAADVAAEQTLIVAPPRCPLPRERLGGRAVFGLLANLYAVESGRNWGAGDLGDLGTLVDFAGSLGAAFVGVNPLHALRNTRRDISPYSPVSRLYRNPLYLDIEAVPEIADTPSVARALAGRAMRARLERLRGGSRVDYAGVMALKAPVIAALHRTFARLHGGAETARGQAYRRYCRAEGSALRDFATYVALDEHLAASAGRDWRRWPRAYRDPASPAVEAFRVRHAAAIERAQWVQFELDRQLAAVAARGRRAGLAIGVYQDVALGSAAHSADAWAFPGRFVLDGTSLGAPPDGLAPGGQHWGLPPLDPHVLRRNGYAYWTRLLRSAFRHAGALRIDHVLGLFRQFWIPPRRPGVEGAYVRFPADDLLGILALESARAGALVIGEDLGTVPPGLPERLREAGVLSTRVLLFSRDRRGAFLRAPAYPRQALLGANTHDMAPLAGWTAGRDLVLRRRHGQLRSARELAAAQRERRGAVAALRARLVDAGLWPADRPADGADPAFRGAVHAFLCRTPSALVGIALDDLAGVVDPVNLPGVDLDRYPSWSRRPGLPLERLATDPAVALALAGMARRRRPGR
ncbi:MAG: 4-alpha-glucanotransferase [Deltaproteobacteria bacterium]|nr:4-alpha-glucanotransferase [Deltaproteobacteria bacterium]